MSTCGAIYALCKRSKNTHNIHTHTLYAICSTISTREREDFGQVPIECARALDDRPGSPFRAQEALAAVGKVKTLKWSTQQKEVRCVWVCVFLCARDVRDMPQTIQNTRAHSHTHYVSA